MIEEEKGDGRFEIDYITDSDKQSDYTPHSKRPSIQPRFKTSGKLQAENNQSDEKYEMLKLELENRQNHHQYNNWLETIDDYYEKGSPTQSLSKDQKTRGGILDLKRGQKDSVRRNRTTDVNLSLNLMQSINQVIKEESEDSIIMEDQPLSDKPTSPLAQSG